MNPAHTLILERQYLRSILILSSYVFLGFRSGLFPLGGFHLSSHALLIFRTRATCLASLIYLDTINLILHDDQCGI